MAVTFHEWVGTLPATLTAAITVGDCKLINTDTVGVAMGTGTNTELIYKIDGLVKGLAKSTAAAFLNGDAVWFNSTAAKWAVATATTKAHGVAYGAQAAATTTCDVILRPTATYAGA